MAQRELHLAVDHVVGFAVGVAALGVTENDHLDAEVLELEDGHLAGVRALLVGTHVLCAEKNIGSGNDLRYGVERGK